MATSSIWAVIVLVAGTARSGPAAVVSSTSTTSAIGLAGSLVMPITEAPAARTAVHVVKIFKWRRLADRDHQQRASPRWPVAGVQARGRQPSGPARSKFREVPTEHRRVVR